MKAPSVPSRLRRKFQKKARGLFVGFVGFWEKEEEQGGGLFFYAQGPERTRRPQGLTAPPSPQAPRAPTILGLSHLYPGTGGQ